MSAPWSFHRYRSTGKLPASEPLVSAHADDTHIPDDPVEFVEQPRQILHILRNAAEARRPVRINSPHLTCHLHSRLLGLDAENDRLMLAELAEPAFNRILGDDRQVNLIFDHLGFPVLCSVNLVGVTAHNQRTCHVATLPTWLLIGQLRCRPRVSLRNDIEATLEMDFADGDHQEGRILDVSEGGVGLIIPHLPLRGLRARDIIPSCRLKTSKGGVAPLELAIRHVCGGADGYRIGASIERATATALHRLRVLLLQLQAAGRPFS